MEAEVFDAGNVQFRTLLKAFQAIVKDDPRKDDVEDVLSQLKQAAVGSSLLTFRQTDAIVGRCNNYLAGTYGKTKKPEHFDHVKPEKK